MNLPMTKVILNFLSKRLAILEQLQIIYKILEYPTTKDFQL